MSAPVAAAVVAAALFSFRFAASAFSLRATSFGSSSISLAERQPNAARKRFRPVRLRLCCLGEVEVGAVRDDDAGTAVEAAGVDFFAIGVVLVVVVAVDGFAAADAEVEAAAGEGEEDDALGPSLWVSPAARAGSAAVEVDPAGTDAPDCGTVVSAAGGDAADMVAAAAFSGVAGVSEMDGAEGDGWPVVEVGSGRADEGVDDVSIAGSAAEVVG